MSALRLPLGDKRVVHKAFVRFRGLLYELGLSPHKTQVFAIKLEVDTNPPDGALLSTTSLKPYRAGRLAPHVALNLQHHDRASLFAGKLHAVLQRVYVKGRDIFDLWWYLSQPEWPEPNLNQLNHALMQSGWTGPQLSPDNWREYVRQRIEPLDWKKEVSGDIEAFVIVSDWEKELTKASLLTLLER